MTSDARYQGPDVRQFDAWSRTYEASWMQRLLFDRVHAAALNLATPLPQPADLLDVGCGTGRLLRAAARRWPSARLLGVDPAEGMVAAARRLTPNATIQRGLAEALPLPDASVDLALSTMSFHHWGDQAGALREIARILRPGGHFILADFAPLPALARLRLSGRAQPLAERQRLFAAAGLRVEGQRRAAYPLIVATRAVRALTP